MHSIWEKNHVPGGFPALDKNIRTDVLIIGGGMCGLLCAYLLHRAGIDYQLVEAETLCTGITKNTTAKITLQHGLIYDKLIRKFGPEKAEQYLLANSSALKKYASLCQSIDCGFEYKDSYVYSLDNRQKIAQEVAAYQQLGVPAEFRSTLPLPFPVAGAVKLTEQAQFHPLQFARGISKGLNIYEHTRVQELIGTKAVTPDGTIQANKILVTTHFPFLSKHGCYFLKLYQHRSYVLALKNTPQLAVNAGEAVINLLCPTAKRCPHLGCALKWNPQEHTWDCPCHGSRFTEDGRLIDNPATGDLK